MCKTSSKGIVFIINAGTRLLSVPETVMIMNKCGAEMWFSIDSPTLNLEDSEYDGLEEAIAEAFDEWKKNRESKK